MTDQSVEPLAWMRRAAAEIVAVPHALSSPNILAMEYTAIIAKHAPASPQLQQISPEICDCAAGKDAYLFCHGDTCRYKQAIRATMAASPQPESAPDYSPEEVQALSARAAREIAAGEVYDLPADEPESAWISVEERLPEPLEEVRVWVNFHNYKSWGVESWLEKDGTWAMGSARDYTVTHWQPLPTAPAQKGRKP